MQGYLLLYSYNLRGMRTKERGSFVFFWTDRCIDGINDDWTIADIALSALLNFIVKLHFSSRQRG